jgi:hypothetical protein
LSSASNLPKARVAAISFDKLDLETGMEVADPTGKMARLFHPWSILAWQLAGKKGLKIHLGYSGDSEIPSRATAGYCFSPLFGLLRASRDFVALHA